MPERNHWDGRASAPIRAGGITTPVPHGTGTHRRAEPQHQASVSTDTSGRASAPIRAGTTAIPSGSTAFPSGQEEVPAAPTADRPSREDSRVEDEHLLADVSLARERWERFLEGSKRRNKGRNTEQVREDARKDFRKFVKWYQKQNIRKLFEDYERGGVFTAEQRRALQKAWPVVWAGLTEQNRTLVQRLDVSALDYAAAVKAAGSAEQLTLFLALEQEFSLHRRFPAARHAACQAGFRAETDETPIRPILFLLPPDFFTSVVITGQVFNLRAITSVMKENYPESVGKVIVAGAGKAVSGLYGLPFVLARSPDDVQAMSPPYHHDFSVHHRSQSQSIVLNVNDQSIYILRSHFSQLCRVLCAERPLSQGVPLL